MNEKETVKFFFNPLKSKLLMILITAKLLFVFSFHEIFGKTFFLAPDERGYLQVAKDVYATDYDYVQWGWPWRSPTWFLKLIYSPFKILLEIGLPDMIAIRSNTILYSSASVYLVLAIFYLHNPSKRLSILHKLSLATFFLPTYFLWSSIGLREGFLYFSFSLIGSGMVLISRLRKRSGLFLMSSGCVFLAYTKDYMYLVFATSLLFLIVLRSFQKQNHFKVGVYYLIAVIMPILLTPTITPSLKTQVTQIVFGKEVPRANLAGNSTNGEIGAWGTERALSENCEDSSSIRFILKLIKPSEKIGANNSCKSPINGSKSPNDFLDPIKSRDIEGLILLSGDENAWATSRAAKLSLEPAHLSEPGKLFIQFIKMITLPIPLIDNGSSSLNIIAWESPFWLALIFLVYLSIIGSFISRKKLSDLNLLSSTFIFLVLLSSTLTEINVGTMVRHRSLVLILCLFVILTMDKTIYQKLSIRNLATTLKRKGS